MIGRTNAGGGAGGGLNFKVVGGTSAPASPKENTIWVNTSTAITSWDFSATEPTKRSKNKNLILYPYYETTKTDKGITFTSNADGTITANGTASAAVAFDVIYSWNNTQSYPLEVGKTYTLSGCPVGGSASGYRLQAVFRSTSNTTDFVSDYGSGLTFTADTTKYRMGVRIVLESGTKVSNLVFKPQLEKGSTATSFVKGDATGQVWISTGAFSSAPFNALKKNNITVYPLSAKQYVSGAWVDKTAKSYQNGSWVDWWNGELFINGNQYEAFTGGWVRADYYKGNDDNTNTGTLTVDDTIYLKTSTGTYCKSVRTSNKIDLTNWKTLKYVVTHSVGEASILVTSQVGDVDDVSVAIGDFAVGENSLDINGLTGKYYIGAYVRNGAEVTIEKIYLKN